MQLYMQQVDTKFSLFYWHFNAQKTQVGEGGVFVGIDRSLPNDFSNPDTISESKNVIFYTRFQTWSLLVKSLAKNSVIITKKIKK